MEGSIDSYAITFIVLIVVALIAVVVVVRGDKSDSSEEPDVHPGPIFGPTSKVDAPVKPPPPPSDLDPPDKKPVAGADRIISHFRSKGAAPKDKTLSPVEAEFAEIYMLDAAMMKTTVCRYCDAEIDSLSPCCPVCGEGIGRERTLDVL